MHYGVIHSRLALDQQYRCCLCMEHNSRFFGSRRPSMRLQYGKIALPADSLLYTDLFDVSCKHMQQPITGLQCSQQSTYLCLRYTHSLCCPAMQLRPSGTSAL
jgi:hypothetical protein